MPAATSNIVTVSLQGVNALEALQSTGAVLSGAMSAFLPPTGTAVEALESTGGVVSAAFTGVDPFFGDVALLLTMDGTEGSTSFPDSSSFDNVMTAVNDDVGSPIPSVDTSDPMFGTGAALFVPGSQEGRISTPITPGGPLDLNYTTDLTIEGWFMLTGNAGGLMSDSALGVGSKWTIAVNDSLLLGGEFITTESAVGSSSLTNFTRDTWNHFALVASGGSVTMYLNGVGGLPSGTGAPPVPTTGTLNIGRLLDSVGSFVGQLDEIRITNGVARYTADFTPPDAPFPTS